MSETVICALENIIMRLLLLIHHGPCLSTETTDSHRAFFFLLKVSEARFEDEGMG